eukprot:10703151-Prorocentrum_lima.AAC.1
MLISDARHLNAKLNISTVVQLTKFVPGEKDRFSILAISFEHEDAWYPWLVRANHGHGITLNWPRMFARLT